MRRDNFIRANQIIAFSDASLFSREAVFKCLYWFGDKFYTNVSLIDGFYEITLRPMENSNVSEGELNLYLQKLERDLIDFSLRDVVAKETQNIRDLLVAKAFSNGEFDEDPPGEISDPVGFNPNLNI